MKTKETTSKSLNSYLALLKKQVAVIKDGDALSVADILKMGIIVNTQLKPSRFTLYRLLQRGEIKATNMGTGDFPRYLVGGKSLKGFIAKRYKI